MTRRAKVERTTRESDIVVEIDLDGTGQVDIDTGVPFFDHMLTALGSHASFDLTVHAKGDTEIEGHHTVEDTAIALGQALRQALGPEAMLMVDCHWRFDEARALQALKALAPVALHWFECPIAETHAHWPAMRRLRAATREQGVLLAAAETQVGLASFQTLFDEALYDVVMPDIKYCGGPLEMLKIARRAAEHGVQFSPHNPSGPVCTWHSLQIAALAPECAMLELQFDESDLYDMVQDGAPLSTQGGSLSVERPYSQSLGLNLQVLQAHPYQPVPPGIETQLNR